MIDWKLLSEIAVVDEGARRRGRRKDSGDGMFDKALIARD